MSETSDPQAGRGYLPLIVLNVVVGGLATFVGLMLGLEGDGCNEAFGNPECNFPIYMFWFWVAIVFPTVTVIATTVLAYTILRGRRSARIVLLACSPFVINTSFLWVWLASSAAGMGAG